MATFHTLTIDPPLLNSSCLWASDLAQLRELYSSPFTGAVTTRTATLHGYKENASNAAVFSTDKLSTLNSYGYSPHPLFQYLEWIYTILTETSIPQHRSARKPIILSITASSAADLTAMLADIRAFCSRLYDHPNLTEAYRVHSPNVHSTTLLAIELNTSCPNIPGAPPPSYHLPTLRPLLECLRDAYRSDPTLTIGLKLPPYPDVTRVREVVDCLAEFTYKPNPSEEARNPFAFLTCTNTLGGSVLMADQVDLSSVIYPPGVPAPPLTSFAVPPAVGGLGGTQLHPLALGTVLSLSRALAAHADPAIRAIRLIGVGGVTDCAAAGRMRAAGASVVACATLLGKEGVRAFELLTDSSAGALTVEA
ncbi:FMN-linked oxidoreductase [Wolfiporia cocos MD-104 SS10]|uniref:FMN-linked oxidoreductase n=1 Tax=Wolfiporia cocos (strain MD-104) TaxID=742152 RepID=A0A2H3ITB6_WOLCO|nr:FMN-linked oxidoreductase [Wolfiporia cocos MD-104 SS10]